MIKTRLFFFLSILLSIYACRTSTEETVSKGNEYFPLKIGETRYYQIDTFVFDLFKREIDTFSSVVKEEIVEKLIDGTNDTVYRVELSRVNPVSSEWEVFRSFERKIVDNYAIEKQDNITELKMIFPLLLIKPRVPLTPGISTCSILLTQWLLSSPLFSPVFTMASILTTTVFQ